MSRGLFILGTTTGARARASVTIAHLVLDRLLKRRLAEPWGVRLDSSVPSRSPTSWTFAPSRPQLILRCDAATGVTALRGYRGELQRWENPFDALEWLGQFFKLYPGKPSATLPCARWIGYLAYDLGRYFEHLPKPAGTALPTALFSFTFHDGLDIDCHDAFRRPRYEHGKAPELRSNFSREQYLAAVERIIEYIRAGDIFQANLSQRFTTALTERPCDIYYRLHGRAPAVFGAYLQFDDHALLCSSPELFLRVTPRPDGSRHVVTRPIKGTRPRAPGMDEQLRASIKDEAELNMIVDLERNDLGRVCEIGSVKVTEPRVIEAHPTVYHGAATIEGILRPDVSFVDLLRATFPGGSVTGAPKIRAMQIIDELEPTRRGPYCGAIGYLAADGSMEFNVAIRTMIVENGRVHVPVGGGIVADSDPAAEYDETLVKARAMFDALGLPVARAPSPVSGDAS